MPDAAVTFIAPRKCCVSVAAGTSVSTDSMLGVWRMICTKPLITAHNRNLDLIAYSTVTICLYAIHSMQCIQHFKDIT